MLPTYSFRGSKNGEVQFMSNCASFAEIKFMMDCLSCENKACSSECKSDRFLRELEDRGEATVTEVVDACVYTTYVWRNEQ